MFFVYILYSETLDRFYVGSTEDIEQRVQWHNNGEFSHAYTIKGRPWVLRFSHSCNSRSEAMTLEKKIKAKKSSKYIRALIQFPEIIHKL